VTVRKFTGHRHNVGSTPFHTVSKAVEVTDNDCFNALVDNVRMEAVALIKDRDEAKRSIWLGDGRSRRLPPGIVAALDLEGFNYTVKGGSEMRDNPVEWRGQKYFAAPLPRAGAPDDEAAAVAVLDRSIATCRADIDKLKRESEVVHKDLKERVAEKTQLDRKLSDYDKVMESTQREITQLEQHLDDLKATQVEMKNDSAQIEIEGLEETIQAHEERIEGARTHIERLKLLIQEAETTVGHLQQAERDAKAELDAALDALDNEEKAQDEFASSYRPFAEKKKQAEDRVEALQVTLKKEQAKAELSAKAAADVCAQATKDSELSSDGTPPAGRVDTGGMTVAKAEAQVNSFRALVKKEADRLSRGGEEPEARIIRVKHAAKRANDRLAKMHEDIQVIKDRVKLLKKSMRRREAKFAEFKQYTEDLIRHYFGMYLQHRGNSGTVIFSEPNANEQGKVKLVWNRARDGVDQSTQEADVDFDARQLSGGERSYTSMALLMAMGLNCETPFRVMDEFDVFMDAQSRMIAIDELVKDAAPPDSKDANAVVRKRGRNRQNIFITPLEIDKAVPDRPYIKKLKLSPSEASFGTKGQ